MTDKKPRKMRLGRRQVSLIKKLQHTNLLKTFTDAGVHFSLIDGRSINAEVVESIFKHGMLTPVEDGLFEGMSQQYALKVIEK